MESEVDEWPPKQERSWVAGTLVLERPDVPLDAAFGAEPGPPGITLAEPAAAPVAPTDSKHAFLLSAKALDGRAEQAASQRARSEQIGGKQRIWDVLAAWRAAVRSIATAEPDTTVWYERHAEIAGLRALYHARFAAAGEAAIPPRRMVLLDPPRAGGTEGVVEKLDRGDALDLDPGA